MGVTPFTDFDAAIEHCDVVMMLRLQNERMAGAYIPSTREYHLRYGLTLERLARARPDAPVMHPGPMNRGVENASNVTEPPPPSAHPDPAAKGVGGGEGGPDV